MWLVLWLTAVHARVVKFVMFPHGKLVGTPSHVTSTNDGFCTDYGGSKCEAECKSACNQPSACLEKAEKLRVAARDAMPPESEYDVILIITPHFEYVRRATPHAPPTDTVPAIPSMYVGFTPLRGYGLEFETFATTSAKIAKQCKFGRIKRGGRLGSAEAIPLVLGLVEELPYKGKKPLMIYSTGTELGMKLGRDAETWEQDVAYGKNGDDGACLRYQLDAMKERVLVVVSGDLSQNHQPKICQAPYSPTGKGMVPEGNTLHETADGRADGVRRDEVPFEFEKVVRSWVEMGNPNLLGYAWRLCLHQNGANQPNPEEAYDEASDLQFTQIYPTRQDRAIMAAMAGGTKGAFPVSAMPGLRVMLGMLLPDRAYWEGRVTAYEVPTFTGMMVATWTPCERQQLPPPVDYTHTNYMNWKDTLDPGPKPATPALRTSPQTSLAEVFSRPIRREMRGM